MALSLKPIEIVKKGDFPLLTKANHWERVFLSDIAEVQNGFAFKSKYFTHNKGVPLIRIRDIENVNTEHLYNGPYDEAFIVRFGDFLIGMDGDFKAAKWQGNNGLLNQRVCRVTLTSSYFSPNFFFYCLNPYLRAINAETSSVTVKHLSARTIEQIPLPLPPLPEQHRIVAKIEQLFSELDKGVESLTTARKQLTLYRQALLKHAFAGKLTEKWRAEHQDQLESADQLLARIKKERENHFQQQLTDWEKAVAEWKKKGKKGKKPTKPRKLKELPEITPKDAKALPALPKRWMWIKIDKIHNHEPYAIKAGPFGSSLKKEFYVPSGYKIYGQEQVISGDWQIGDYYINDDKYSELENCRVAPNDILISLVGTVGKVLILPEGIQDGIINPRLIKISPNITAYHPAFFKYYFESHFLKDLYKLQTHGATMDVLNLGIIQQLPFPFCSLNEQKEIVNILDLHFSVIDQCEKIIEDNLIAVKQTRQSILKKAFSGQLVPQDPGDEPASKLLARIKAEREAAQKGTKKRPRKSRKKKEVKSMANLLDVVGEANDWLSAQDAFRQCGIGDGAQTIAIEKIYEELRDHVKGNRIAVERRGEEDWLCLVQGA